MKFIYLCLYTLFCIILFWFIVFYVSSNYAIIESMDIIYSPYDINISKTNHNVDLPINTIYSCQNMCGPQSQCSITREQCTSDIDCYGCQPPKHIKGYNGDGRLVYNQNPQYSALTTDIGTNATFYNKQNIKVPKPYLGVDQWMNSANVGMQFFYKAMNYPYFTNPNKFINLPEYKVRESVTGLFEDYGPLSANAKL